MRSKEPQREDSILSCSGCLSGSFGSSGATVEFRWVSAGFLQYLRGFCREAFFVFRNKRSDAQLAAYLPDARTRWMTVQLGLLAGWLAD